MDPITDFANSHLTFELTGVNVARINLDARCTWVDLATGAAEDFVLICPCQGEKMYVPDGLIQDPPFNFLGVFSATQSHLIRHHADAAVQRDTVENHQGRFSQVTIALASFPKAIELTTDQQIVEATLKNRPLIARTGMVSADGKTRAVLEYPVTTMNVEPQKNLWQVDTGPVLIPDFERPTARRIERLVPGFIVYNRRDYAEWTLRVPTKLADGGQTFHYSDRRRGTVTHHLFAGQPV
jgi:hypothetical protein